MPLSNKQRRLIFSGYRKIGLEEADRHLLQREITGKESLKAMNGIDFRKLVRHLEKCGFQVQDSWQPATNPAGGDGAKIRLITKLYAVWGTLAGTYYIPGKEKAALRGFLRKRIGPSHENFCTVEQLIAAGEAIKSIARRTETIYD